MKLFSLFSLVSLIGLASTSDAHFRRVGGNCQPHSQVAALVGTCAPLAPMTSVATFHSYRAVNNVTCVPNQVVNQVTYTPPVVTYVPPVQRTVPVTTYQTQEIVEQVPITTYQEVRRQIQVPVTTYVTTEAPCDCNTVGSYGTVGNIRSYGNVGSYGNIRSYGNIGSYGTIGDVCPTDTVNALYGAVRGINRRNDVPVNTGVHVDVNGPGRVHVRSRGF